jgi:hypothetical protein
MQLAAVQSPPGAACVADAVRQRPHSLAAAACACIGIVCSLLLLLLLLLCCCCCQCISEAQHYEQVGKAQQRFTRSCLWCTNTREIADTKKARKQGQGKIEFACRKLQL